MSMFVHFLFFFFRPVVVTDTGSVMSQKHGIFGYRACQSKTQFFEKFFVPRDSSPQKPLVNEVSAHFFIFEILAVFLLYQNQSKISIFGTSLEFIPLQLDSPNNFYSIHWAEFNYLHTHNQSIIICYGFYRNVNLDLIL